MSELSELAANVSRFEAADVLVIGDVMLDRFVYGTVERISPEAPIPVFRVSHENVMLGGAGNVARNVAGLGARVRFLSAVGEDAAGRDVKRMVAELPRAEGHIVSDARRKTSIKTRYIAAGQQMLRSDDETIEALGDAALDALVDAARQSLRWARAMVLADYGKGVLDGGIAADLIAMGRKADVTVIVDPQGNDYARYRGAGIVTPNRAELALASQMPTASDAEIVAAGASLIQRHGLGRVLATRSADGMTLIEGPTSSRHFPAEAREVFDVSGAGDTVVAALATAIAADLPIDQAVSLANIAAGIVVGKVGTAVAYAADVVDALRHAEAGADGAKVKDLERTMDLVRLWRRQGHRVGFASGCFDLLHPGHLAVIQRAKAASDRLVMGLNSDSSTRKLKGPTRPIQSEDARAQVLASLEAVDAVVIFDDDTPARLIETIRPEVYVKGADYKIEDLPEAKIVQSYGGTVILAELAPGHSTTGTIKKMEKRGSSS